MNVVRHWFTQQRGYTPFDFQQQTWDAQLAGASGLVHAPTGMGKTFAVGLGPMMRWCDAHPDRQSWAALKSPPLTMLWITPLRALASDTANSLREPIEDVGLPWTLELRTGDVSSSIKARQKKRLPSVLVTTPESLSLLLSYADAKAKFAHVQSVVVDEWHELMSTKRGTQTELGLARLRRWNPAMQTWGLSATMGNLEQARDVLLGRAKAKSGVLIRGESQKAVRIETIVPDDLERFPWAGHLGLKLLPQVLDELDKVGSALLFTNTRSQAELWFAAIVKHRPNWIGEVALHHGSLDRKLRQKVEDLLREGKLRCVVCTSSLDLGVDFSPVDRVFQVGSPKGVARLMQRAGRSGHQPGAVSRVLGVPTHAFELIEFAAARVGIEGKRVESRRPLDRPIDVLVQHLVTVAAGGGFDEHALYEEVKATYAFRDLSAEQWQWAMDFVTRGGKALYAYPHYRRVAPPNGDGQYHVSSQQIAKQHRMGIGTITSDAAMIVKLARGRSLGTVEESFIARLKPGDRFLFAGQPLELIKTQNMTAYVRRATRLSGNVPRWQGGKSPLSTQLADAVRAKFDDALAERFTDDEMRAVRPLLELQRQWSRLPAADELLIESATSREGHHLFAYPFQGRLVHEGLGALLAYRLSQQAPRSITATVNDYGLELMCPEPIAMDEKAWRDVLSTDRLVEDLLACLNATELARRQFREIARVAGLIFTGYPGQSKSTRQLQASSELFYDVFAEFDADNLLLDQARREVLEEQLEVRRLKQALERIEAMRLVRVTLEQLSPLAFPLWAEHLRENHVTSEHWSDRVRAMAVALEKVADDG
ncbi:ligase-associated DNA damage response DEXH box helicase [Phycisphaerales bacterium AB-hyl4]|uniref:Ligase-associated DNA damage response DEXH box helicase n=1 Tax=Natronomicrosphaera hydrolytica TaxID=3242702 RepID=A0ABV4U3U4_9BACT